MNKTDRSWPNIITLSCGVIVTAAGLITFIGWILGIPALKSVLPGLVTMKVNTSLGFIFSGLSLIFFATIPNGILRKASVITAILVLLIGSLTAFEYVTNADLGIDQLVMKEDAHAVGTLSPGRMAPSTAICFIIFGAALLLSSFGGAALAAQALSLTIILLGLINFIGYIYDVKSLYGISRFTQMAVHTAIAFIFLGSGTIMARADKGIAAILSGKGLGSIAVRRLLPLIIAVPLVIGYLRVTGERSGIFSSELGVGLVAFMYILILSLSVLSVASRINRDDIERTNNLTMLKSLSDRLLVSAEEWSNTFNAITDMVFIQNNEYTILNANKAFCEAMKMPSGQIVGKKCYQLLHGKDHPWPNCPMEKTRVDSKSHTEEISDPNIGATLLVTTSPLLDDNDRIIGSVHVARDISDRKKMQAELQKRVESLEKFQKITVDRELKMKELKARIAKLEERANT